MFFIPMKPPAFLLCPLWFIYLQLLVLFSFNLLLRVQPSRTTSALGNQTDHLALLKFRESISSDPYDIFASWNSSTHYCKWPGIRCGHRHRQRVTSLELEGFALQGVISPHIGNLSFLRLLNLQNNSITGTIPQELGHLFRLQQLWLTNNTLVGEIPTNLTSCSELSSLSLTGNRLVGQIPKEIGALHKLQLLSLGKNNLSGQFPVSLWNLSSLDTLYASENNLDGKIPEEICQLNLRKILVYSNELSGMLPSSLYNMSSLTDIAISVNKLNGSLPSNIFLNLHNLQWLAAGGNQFSGPIPNSFINATKLRMIDVSRNNFVGQIPKLGRLQDLWFLSLGQNNLGTNSSKDWEFMKSLINCTNLRAFDIHNNNFGGTLPDLIGNFSNQLSTLYLGVNHMYGKVPETLGKLTNLVAFALEGTYVTGRIPHFFGRFQKMQLLSLWGNRFSGKIPSSIGNLSQLFKLDLSRNMLEGNIPPSIGNCKNLQLFDLSQNNLRGDIPSEVIGLSSLIFINLSSNLLSGNLPSEVGKLTNTYSLDVSQNHLIGNIPETIGYCTSLEYLYLQGNLFYGNIPSSLALLKGLRRLDLSRNNFSGAIPKLLQNISDLEYLNVSFNMLDGEVPKEGVFHNESQLSIVGNDKLCGGILELHLPPCHKKVNKQSKHHTLILIIAIASMVGFLLLLSSLLVVYCTKRRVRKSSSTTTSVDQVSKVSYQSLHQATNAFSTSNLIGSGSYSSVYKGILESENSIVAIKVLNLQKKGAHKSFIAECNALKNIRHRNLVKIFTCCSSLDYKGVEFKALIFEYMKNGSLEQWLHPRRESKDHLRTLDLDQRLNILIDIACALHYLHYECEQPIIHCDLKPSNILLDDDMVAHVSDFGLTRIISTINKKQISTTGIEGTIGYAPPEYGMGSKLSTQGDLYSFGILILEMLTGKRPTDEMFKDGLNLHNYVKMAFPNNLVQILDPFLAQREAIRGYKNVEKLPMIHSNEEKCFVSLFEMGLACSMESPKERMNMVEASKRLNQIKKAFWAGRTNAHCLHK